MQHKDDPVDWHEWIAPLQPLTFGSSHTPSLVDCRP
jgi:hypothetical protein